MPFQVVFNTVQIGLPTVTLLSAGSDRNIACGNLINLEGTVDILENLPGHAILWEQTAGVPVVLTSPNTLATSYSFVERSDKIFRLWLDKGTDFQQFKEVSIFHTPQSDVYMGLSNSETMVTLEADVVTCNDIVGELTVDVGYPNPDGPVDRTPCQLSGDPALTGLDFDFVVSWTVPTTKPEMVTYFMDSQLFYADSETSASPRYTDLPGTVVEHHFTPGGENELKRYYIVTRYKIAGRIVTGRSCTVDYTTGITIPSAHAVDDKVSLSLTNSSTEIVRHTSIRLTVPDTAREMRLSNPTTQIIRYRNIIEESLSVVPAMRLSASTINIVRYDPTGIGS